MKAWQKAAAIAVAALIALLASYYLQRGVSAAASGVFFLGRDRCTGVGARPGEDLKCAVALTLRDSGLPSVWGEPAAALRSLDLTRVEALDLRPCPEELGDSPAPITTVAQAASPSGSGQCRVHEGSDAGLSLRETRGLELGAVSVERLLEPERVLPRQLWLLSTDRNAIALVEKVKERRAIEILLKPPSPVTLRVRQTDQILGAQVVHRISAQTPPNGLVRVNMAWNSTPRALWSSLHLSKLSADLAVDQKSSFEWFGRQHSLSYGRIQVEGADLEAHVSPACEGNCFRVVFSSSNAVISGEGVTIEGRAWSQMEWWKVFFLFWGWLLGIAAWLFK